jgi:nifR3 family TIM-barrel protein
MANFGFWGKLKRPFFVLAPMYDVTDSAFRQIVLKCEKPDVFYTEFVSCEGLLSKGKDKLMKHLYFTENERPIVAQFFGSRPENFYKCAELAVELGFDGIDINMGCPDKAVEKQGGGAALIKNPELAVEIINETKRGAGKLPVSVKTRIGFNKIETESWLSRIAKARPALITVHGRTKKEMSKVPAHWEEIGKASEIAKSEGVMIIGNGDVKTISEAKEKAEKYNLDGIMIGRAIFENPWLFNSETIKPSKEQRLKLLTLHSELFIKLWGSEKNFDYMKKFFKVYASGWPGSKRLREKLMSVKDEKVVLNIVSSYLS